MLRSQNNKLRMLYAVRATCAKHESVWNSVVGFVETYNKFNEQLAAIERELDVQVNNTTGVTSNKNALRLDLVAQYKRISGAIISYATEIKDQEIINSLNITESDLLRMKANLCVVFCEKVSKMADDLSEQIAPLGVTPEVIADFKAKIDEFSVQLSAPRLAISRKSMATARMKAIFKEITKTLSMQLDRLMENFVDNKEFYEEYFYNRSIIDLKGGSSANDDFDADPDDETPSFEAPFNDEAA